MKKLFLLLFFFMRGAIQAQEPALDVGEFVSNNENLKLLSQDDIQNGFSTHSFIPNQTAGTHVKLEWVKYYGSGMSPGHNIPIKIVLDDSGNCYITGNVSLEPYGNQIYTAKIGYQKNIFWENFYAETSGANAIASGIQVDAKGNVYVTGKVYHPDTGDDIVTIKYDAAGKEQWVQFYDGPAHANDYPVAIEVDPRGNIIIGGVGKAQGTPGISESGQFYLIIKYDPDGNVKWTARYNGLTNVYDYLNDLKIDDQGNVYVTGESTSYSYWDRQFATLKYDSNGVFQWRNRYDSQGEDIDCASFLGLDRYRNVYVAGTSMKYSGTDIVLIKYDFQGNRKWVQPFLSPKYTPDGLRGLLVDKLGNAYILCGNSGDIFIKKFLPNGELAWSKNIKAAIISFALDNQNNVLALGIIKSGFYTTGMRLFRFDENGNETKRLDYILNFGLLGDAVGTVDEKNNLFVAGESQIFSTTTEMTIEKYDSTGESQWSIIKGGKGNSCDKPEDMVMDDQGNIYITGSSLSSLSGYDFLTLKYNAQGQLAWASRYTGAGDFNEYAQKIAVDKFQNSYITGYTEININSLELCTIKYNASGVQQWIKPYFGPGGLDSPLGINTDSSGNAYVIAQSRNERMNTDILILKYLPSGKVAWEFRYDRDGNCNENILHFTNDPAGNTYILALSEIAYYEWIYFILKCNSEGKLEWISEYDTPFQYNLFPVCLARDKFDNIYAAGTEEIYKFNKNGKRIWHFRYESDIRYPNLHIDNAAAIYIAGRTKNRNQLGSFDAIRLMKYDSLGNNKWNAIYCSDSDEDFRCSFLTTDKLNNIYLSGIKKVDTDYDLLTIRYDSDGQFEWATTVNSIKNKNEIPIGIAVNDSGEVFVAGGTGHESFSFSTPSLFALIKYIQSWTDFIVDEQAKNVTNFQIEQNFPNPFNSTTIFQYSLPTSGRVSLKIYNLVGQEIATLIDDFIEKGKHEIKWTAPGNLATGVYIYRLSTKNRTITRKLIYIK